MKQAIDSILQKLTTAKVKCPKCESTIGVQDTKELTSGFANCGECGFTFPVKNAIKWQ